MNNKFYTYVYCDPRKRGVWPTSIFTFWFEPFYVGEGQGNRMYDHLKPTSHNSHKNNKVAKIRRDGYEPIVFQISNELTGDEGIELETKLICEIGTVKHIETVKQGSLTNQKIQPPGKQIFSDEARLKISQSAKTRIVSDETKAKRALTKANTPLNIKHQRAKIRSVRMMGRVVSVETRAKLSVSNKGKNKGKPSPNKGKLSPCRGIPRSVDVIAKIKDGCTKRKPWSYTWLLEFEDGSPSAQIQNLTEWGRTHGYVPLSLDHAGRDNRFHRGVRATKVSQSPQHII